MFKWISKLLHLTPPLQAVATKKDHKFGHIVKRRGQPFYCGTAFCGHTTRQAAESCWARHCATLEELNRPVKELFDEADCLRLTGQSEAAQAKRRDAMNLMVTNSNSPAMRGLFPELDSRNWPINRDVRQMQNEYISRAIREVNNAKSS
jgi:hypothetical protein